MAECVAVGSTTGTLQGICPGCSRMIYCRMNPQKLDAVRGDWMSRSDKRDNA